MQKKKGCLIVILGVFAVFAIIGIVMALTMKPEDMKTGIAKYIDVTDEQGKQIDENLKKCGIEELKAAEHDELLDNAHFKGETGYRLSDDNAKNIILYLDGDKKTYLVKYADYTLYEDNSSSAKLSDYVITTNEATDIEIKCENVVKNILKSPSTAKFPNITEWKMKKEKNIFTVQSYVDSQNSFGATMRSEFQIVVDTKKNEIQSFIFDGNELIK